MVMTLVMQIALADNVEYYLRHMILAYLIVVGPGLLSIDTLLKPWLIGIFPNLSDGAAWLADAPRVVIVGAGFGGVAAALGMRHARARVTLVDRRNYHLFQPLLYQVATADFVPRRHRDTDPNPATRPAILPGNHGPGGTTSIPSSGRSSSASAASGTTIWFWRPARSIAISVRTNGSPMRRV